MSKFIMVYGDGDYGVETFAESEYGIKDIYNEMKKTGVKSLTKRVTTNDGDDEYEDTIYFELYEFGDVDPNFVDFMKNNICDYDQLKDRDIYEVEEDNE